MGWNRFKTNQGQRVGSTSSIFFQVSLLLETVGSWAVLLRKDFRSSSFSCYCLFFFHVLASVCHSMWNSSGLLRIVGDHPGIILRFFQDSLDIVRLLQASSGNVWFLLRFFCLSLSFFF